MKILEMFISKIIDKCNLQIRKRKTIENLSAIYVGERKEVVMKRFLVEKLTLISAALLVMICLVLLTVSTNKRIISNGEILRPKKGEREKEVSIQAVINDKRIPITFFLKEPRLDYKEVQELFQDIDEELVRIILNGNKDLDQIRTKLNLVRTIPNTNITVKWVSSHPLIIDYMGNVYNKNIDENGVEVTLNATLEYNNNEVEKSYQVRVLTPLLTEEELFRIELLEQIVKENEKNPYEDKLVLPEYIGESQIQWRESSSNRILNLLVLIIFVVFAFYKLKDYQLEEKVKKRRQQMILDYSEIVAKLSLLINAGLTTGVAIQKIANDYSSQEMIEEQNQVKTQGIIERKVQVRKQALKQDKNQARKQKRKEERKKERKKERKMRYAYEELVLCCAGLSNGMTEQEVLEKYGQKCQIQEYRKLTSILNQNIKKGTAQMCETLEELTTEAFLNKKAIAKILGEKASTKLLLPMMLLLIVVLLIVVVPTILSINI